MLIITRKSGEGFHIGEGITVTVMEAVKDKVKLGIDAPKDVKIIRTEIYESGKFNVQAAVHKVSIDFMNSFFEDAPSHNKLNQINKPKG